MAELKKVLGYPTIIALSLTAMIGTGMFIGPAVAAKYSGIASILAWVILSFITIYVSLCFGELVSMYPHAGGVYEFAKHTYGRFFSFIIGWITWLVANITTAVLIVASMNYFSQLTVYNVFFNWLHAFLPFLTPMLLEISLAIILILVLNIVAFRGIEASSAIMIFFAIVTVGVILAVLIPGFFHIEAANFTPFLTVSPIFIFVSLFFIMETFFGWESATFLAEETKDAEKVIPRSLLWTTIIVAVLGVGMAFMLLGVLPLNTLAASQAPLSTLSSFLSFNPAMVALINVGIILALIGSAAGGVVSSPRLLMALARDKLFIQQLSDIHPKYHTPYKAIIFQIVITILVVLIGFGQYTKLLSMLIPLALFMYISVLLSVTILRYRKPDNKRYFKVPFAKVGPVLVSLFYLGVIISWLFTEANAFSLFRILLSFILLGIPIYLLLMFYYDPDAIIKVNSWFAYLTLWMENFLLPKDVRKDILSLFKDLRDKAVLEYGAGVGTLTLHLAEAVGPKGKVYATELSPRNIAILKSRLKQEGHFHVQVIHDEHQVNRIHPDVHMVDYVFSVGMLGYMQDVGRILKDIRDLLPEHGKICFVEYVDFFWFIPNVPWLSKDEQIKKIFKEAGFSVKVERKKSIFWKYVFVYGIKSDEEIPFI
jgi:APA family basic amino acid/polyamine antiporter